VIAAYRVIRNLQPIEDNYSPSCACYSLTGRRDNIESWHTEVRVGTPMSEHLVPSDRPRFRFGNYPLRAGIATCITVKAFLKKLRVEAVQ
jgi:hypothetical protein